MFVHSDSPGKKQCHLLSQNDTYSTCCELDYGVVAYFGDFEGGEIFYHSFNKDGTLSEINLNLDECLIYKPEAGDVVIHSAYAPYYHGTLPVLSGVRYAYSCFATNINDFPETYYKYGSNEYKENVRNGSEESLLNWTKIRKSQKDL